MFRSAVDSLPYRLRYKTIWREQNCLYTCNIYVCCYGIGEEGWWEQGLHVTFGTWKIRTFVLSVALIMDTMTLSESAHLHWSGGQGVWDLTTIEQLLACCLVVLSSAPRVSIMQSCSAQFQISRSQKIPRDANEHRGMTIAMVWVGHSAAKNLQILPSDLNRWRLAMKTCQSRRYRVHCIEDRWGYQIYVG